MTLVMEDDVFLAQLAAALAGDSGPLLGDLLSGHVRNAWRDVSLCLLDVLL